MAHWPGAEQSKRNGAGLSRSGVRAGIFPQKIQEERSCASSFSAQTHSAPAEFCSGHSQKYRAQRKPMLLLEFAGELFRFRAKTPALEVLFQLPPRWKANIAVFAAPPLARPSNDRAVWRLCVGRNG
jgi:hypothetical protein